MLSCPEYCEWLQDQTCKLAVGNEYCACPCADASLQTNSEKDAIWTQKSGVKRAKKAKQAIFAMPSAQHLAFRP